MTQRKLWIGFHQKCRGFFSKALFKRLDNRKFCVIFNLDRIRKEGRVCLAEKVFQV
jgi:hypothetical protein